MTRNIKRSIPFSLLICLFLGVLVTGCDQEPLFWDVAHEYPPIEPIIKGGPSRVVECNSALYVSNGNSIWEWKNYNTPGPPNWQRFPNPPRSIKELAATDSFLFALDWNGGVWKYDGTNWDNIIKNNTIEHIFGAGNNLFAGELTGTKGTKNGYSILSMNASGTSMSPILPDTGLLMGVANNGGTYYLGTLGDGVYSTTTPLTLITPSDKLSSVEEDVIGLTYYNGKLYVVSTYQIQDQSGGRITSGSFTGAIAGWTDGTNNLLLVGLGRSSSNSVNFGYREINLASPSFSLRIPGEDNPTSVEVGSQYTSAISKHVVNYLYVVPGSDSHDNGGRPIIFASTAKNGLWSYRTRDNRAQWNGEDNSPF